MKRHAGIATPALDAGDRGRGRRRPAAGRGRPAAGRGRPGPGRPGPGRPPGPAGDGDGQAPSDPGRLGHHPAVRLVPAGLVHPDQRALPVRRARPRRGRARSSWASSGTRRPAAGRPGRSSPCRAVPATRPPTTPASTGRCSARCSACANLLLVNLRGTGNSSSFTCRALQGWTQADSIAAYTADTGKCGRQLNHTRRLKGGGGYVQASDLYTTADAARDVALLLRRLQTGRIDLYGDSYGTYFSQVFTARYARMLRSVTLDSAYPVTQHDPWYRSTIRTARRAFPLACLRSVACHAAAPGSSWARIVRLAGSPASSSGHRPDQDCLRPGRHRAGRRRPADRAGQQRRHGQHRVPRARSRGPGAARRG